MKTNLSLAIGLLIFSTGFSQQKNIYQAESEGYFTTSLQTSFGTIATNNLCSKIYLINGNNLEEIVASPGCGRYMTLSPDRSRAGFKYIGSNGEQVPAVYDFAEGKITTLAAPSALCGQVSFAHDGSMAYTTGSILNVVHGNNTNLFDLGTYSNIAPISPDGKFAVFNSDDDKLFVIDLTTSQKKQITDANGGYACPKWSPDGSKVLYSSLAGHLLVWEKFSGMTYSLGRGKNASWSGDSKHILFDRTDMEGLSFKGSDIFIADFDGARSTNLTQTQGENEMYPSFGNGNTISFSIPEKCEIVSSGIDLQNLRLTSSAALLKTDHPLLSVSDYYSNLSSGGKNNNPVPMAITTVQGKVPYVNQVYDTPNWHNGHASCAPTSAVMALAYYNKLPYWDYTCSTPSSHTSHYGNYVADKYNYNEIEYTSVAADWGGYDSWGGYGYMWTGSYSPNSRMAGYLQNHGVTSSLSYSTTFTNVTSEIDQSHPFPICNMLTSYGHLTLAIGYVNGQHTLIFNDPYGNKNSGYWPNFTGADSYYDWPGYNNGYQNLNSIAWTVTAQSAQPAYNDTIIDDTYYNNGFYIYNQGTSHMRYFHDKKTGGYKSHFWYTTTSASTSIDTCYVKWTADIPASGNYQVSAYIPSSNATASAARYKVYYSGGSKTVVIDQSASAGKWVSLGTFAFAKGTAGYVRLGDAAGTGGQKIAFDAVKWNKVQPTATAVEELSITDFQVYPNPAADHIIFDLPGNTGKGEIDILNLLGEKQMSLSLTGEQTHIPLSYLPAGVYVIEVRSEGKTGRLKFIRQ